MIRHQKTAAAALAGAVLIVATLTAPKARAEDENNPRELPAPAPPPGMVHIPAGSVFPGCTQADYKARANNDVQEAAFAIEVWGRYKDPIRLPGFYAGKFEVSNAQWKLYLDRNFRVTVKTTGNQTLESLAHKHITFLDDPVKGQWKAIYALNWQVVSEALKKNFHAQTEADKKANKKPRPLWDPAWTIDKPAEGIRRLFLPEGLELVFYSHAVPKHWYGWCRLSGLSTGKEYCDVRAAPKDAFIVPTDPKLVPIFARARLRAADFKNYPMRDVAPLEALAFVEWAGGHLPSEYEFERIARNDKPNSRQHPGAGRWEHGKQPTRFAFGDNPACRLGPLPVDDESVAAGDSDFGNRHILGNVHELTRTFWDIHPMVVPRPNDEPFKGLLSVALTAKGGAYGSGYRQVQISTRTGDIGTELTLDLLNRTDSLGLRLMRHEQPGYDLMLHTLRRIAFNARLTRWDPPIHGFAMPRMAGVDVFHMAKSSAEDGYTFVQDKAQAISFTPYWSCEMTAGKKRDMDKFWNQKKKPKTDAFFLGVLRSDVPIRAGVPMKPAAWEKLRDMRKTRRDWEKAVKTARGKKLEALKAEEPPEVPAPDAFEAATVKQREQAGVWNESVIPAGEWNVVYWYGFIGLAGKSKRIPPAAILMLGKGGVKEQNGPSAAHMLLLPNEDKIELGFFVEKQMKQKTPMPKRGQSTEWALAETLPNGWRGRKVNKKGWAFKVTIPTAEGALKKHAWNTKK